MARHSLGTGTSHPARFARPEAQFAQQINVNTGRPRGSGIILDPEALQALSDAYDRKGQGRASEQLVCDQGKPLVSAQGGERRMRGVIFSFSADMGLPPLRYSSSAIA